MEHKLYKKLTKRQLEIADCARRGFTDGQIANAFSISINTVKTHLKNIYEKMEVSGRTELAGPSDWHEVKAYKDLPEKSKQFEIERKTKLDQLSFSHLDFLFQFSEIKRFNHIEIGGNGFHVLLEGIVSCGKYYWQVIKFVPDILQ